MKVEKTKQKNIHTHTQKKKEVEDRDEKQEKMYPPPTPTHHTHHPSLLSFHQTYVWTLTLVMKQNGFPLGDEGLDHEVPAVRV